MGAGKGIVVVILAIGVGLFFVYHFILFAYFSLLLSISNLIDEL